MSLWLQWPASSDGYFQQDNAPSQSSNHLRLVSWTWQWVHFTQIASTVTRSPSNRAPLGFGGTGDLHHGCAWVLLVSGSCISLMASWIHKCTALYWKRRCYHHSVPLVVVHFSNMTMILNTHLRPLLDFWRRTGWKWFNGQVCLLIWTQSNTYGEFWSWASLSIQHPISKRGHSWRMEKDRSGKMSPTCSFHA